VIDEEILEKIGIPPQPPKPVASYISVNMCGDMLYVSGQGPAINGVSKYKGVLGLDCSVEDGYQAARLCGINILAQLKRSLGSLDLVQKVVSAHVYVASTHDFHDHSSVANGFSDLFVSIFGKQGQHTRSAVGVSSLPGNIPVEVEAVIEIKRNNS